jgi:hypothetical protein
MTGATWQTREYEPMARVTPRHTIRLGSGDMGFAPRMPDAPAPHDRRLGYALYSHLVVGQPPAPVAPYGHIGKAASAVAI